MRYYIIAGEASGDLHGSNLMRSLGKLDPDADFRYWGGDLMAGEGGTLVQHFRKASFMGFWEVIRNIGTVLSGMRMCKRDIVRYRPDALILIDYPGFNLRMARFASGKGIKVFYYISPKVWAWNQSRVKIIKRYVDHMLTIFPFETTFYNRFGYKVDYVGNPLLDAIGNRSYRDEDFERFTERNRLSGKPLIAMLAGSRIQEIDNCLPVMVSVMDQYTDYQFVIAGAPSIDPATYRKYTGDKIAVLYDQTYAILQHATAALVVSGTATLEAALLGAPQVVCYRGSALSYQIAKRFVKIKYISLVNLIMEKEVVKELIQDDLNSEKLRAEIDKLLFDRDYRNSMLDDMAELKQRLGEPGASERAAGKVVEYLDQNKN